MATESSWTARRSLGRQLKALRVSARKTVEDLRPIGARDKISRIENGVGPYRFPDVQSWALMCGADAATVTRLTDLAEKAKGAGWSTRTTATPCRHGRTRTSSWSRPRT